MVTAGTDDAFTAALRRYGAAARRGPGPGGRRGRVRPARRGAVPGRPVGAAVRDDAEHPALGGRAAATGCRSGRCSCRARRRPASRASCTAPSPGCPAFRWYDRELGRVLVANRPADAAIIEERASNGHGLLADDGVSISNLFSGDAPTSMMTMSRVEARPRVDGDPAGRRAVRAAPGRLRPQHRPDGRRDRQGAVPGACSRGAATSCPGCTGLDVRAAPGGRATGCCATSTRRWSCREMLRGARSVYVDYVDYDEVAHHAGGNRIESLAVARGAGPGARRPRAGGRSARRVATTSSSSPTTASRRARPSRRATGTVARRRCASELDQRRTSSSLEENVESWGRVESVLDDLAGDDSIGRGRAAGRPRRRAVARPRRTRARDGRRPGRAGLGQPRAGLRPGSRSG